MFWPSIEIKSTPVIKKIIVLSSFDLNINKVDKIKTDNEIAFDHLCRK